MKTITINLKVSDDFSDFATDELVRHCEMLVNPDWIAVFWCTDDVKSVASHLSDDEAREVLQVANRRHDAELGINWDVLETIADMLYDRPNQDEEEEQLDEA